MQPVDLADWERQRERKEFEQAMKIFKPLTGVMEDRFTSAQQPDDALNPLAKVEKVIGYSYIFKFMIPPCAEQFWKIIFCLSYGSLGLLTYAGYIYYNNKGPHVVLCLSVFSKFVLWPEGKKKNCVYAVILCSFFPGGKFCSAC